MLFWVLPVSMGKRSRKTIMMARKIRAISVILTLLFASAAGCQKQAALETRPASTSFRTATPTWRDITPEPTATPLFRASRISGHYGESLILYVGDLFTLDNLQDATTPVTYDQNILQLVAGSLEDHTGPKTFRAIKTGVTKITTIVIAPCPNAPIGCQPPQQEILMFVSVKSPGQHVFLPLIHSSR